MGEEAYAVNKTWNYELIEYSASKIKPTKHCRKILYKKRAVREALKLGDAFEIWALQHKSLRTNDEGKSYYVMPARLLTASHAMKKYCKQRSNKRIRRAGVEAFKYKGKGCYRYTDKEFDKYLAI